MNQHQTDVNVFINDLDGGVFVNKLGAVLSEVAFGVNSTNKKERYVLNSNYLHLMKIAYPFPIN